LAEKDPIVPLDEALKEKGKNAFSSILEPGKDKIRKSHLPEVFILLLINFPYLIPHLNSY